MNTRYERIHSKSIYKGHVVDLSIDTFRHQDGGEVTREVVTHPGAVAVVAHDGTNLYLVKQPREATGETDLLEIPAGKLDPDKDGDVPDPIAAGKRELAEEIGMKAASWEHLCSCFSTPGFSNELVHIYLATDLSEQYAECEEDERIDVVQVPLSDVGRQIAQAKDAKTLIGLLMLQSRLAV